MLAVNEQKEVHPRGLVKAKEKRPSMQQRSGDELSLARKAAARRYYEAGLAMLKEAGVENWTFHENGLYGRCSEKHLSCPKPTTRRRLYILAHECGHAALNHAAIGKGQPTHRKEYEAELYAHEALRRYGIAVPRKETQRAKEYVARRIDMAVRRHTTKLDREAVKWTRGFHHAATTHALTRRRIQLVDMTHRKKQVLQRRQ